MGNRTEQVLGIVDSINNAVYASYLITMFLLLAIPDEMNNASCKVTHSFWQDNAKLQFFVCAFFFAVIERLITNLQQKMQSTLDTRLDSYRAVPPVATNHSEFKYEVARELRELAEVVLFSATVVLARANFFNTVILTLSPTAFVPVIMLVAKLGRYPHLIRGTVSDYYRAIDDGNSKYPKLYTGFAASLELGWRFIGPYAAISLVIDEFINVYYDTLHASAFPSRDLLQALFLTVSLSLSLGSLISKVALTALRFLKSFAAVFFSYSMVLISTMDCVSNAMTAEGFENTGLPLSMTFMLLSAGMASRFGYVNRSAPYGPAVAFSEMVTEDAATIKTCQGSVVSQAGLFKASFMSAVSNCKDALRSMWQRKSDARKDNTVTTRLMGSNTQSSI